MGMDGVSYLNLSRNCVRLFLLTLCVFAMVHSLAAQDAADADVSSASPQAILRDQDIEVTAEFLSTGVFRKDKHVFFRVRATWLESGEQLSTRLEGTPELHNFRILSSSTSSIARRSPGGFRKEEIYQFRLMPIDEGPARVGSVEIVVRSKSGEEVKRLSTLPCDTTIGIAKPSLMRFLPLASGIVVGIAIVVVVVRLVLCRCRKEDEPVVTPPPASSPVEDLLAQARRWRMEGDPGRYYSTLERIVGEELAKRYSYHKGRLSSSKDLPPDTDSDTRRLVDSFFTRCAEGKYSPGIPSREELDRIWEDAKRLLSMGDSSHK
ncbi:MAG TPA: hypothetical protein PK395_12760 [bacterium]|nr:hypothetical protein [bacterium]HQP99483.1 hypothetical protein [bacterium]